MTALLLAALAAAVYADAAVYDAQNTKKQK